MRALRRGLNPLLATRTAHANREKTSQKSKKPQITSFFMPDFMYKDLTGRSFRSLDLTYHRFDGSTLTGCDFSFSVCDLTTFIGCNLSGANFSHALITRSSFARADITGAIFTDAEITECDFYGAKLAGANFVGVDLPNVGRIALSHVRRLCETSERFARRLTAAEKRATSSWQQELLREALDFVVRRESE